MPIPENIERENIFQAMLKVKREEVPAKRLPREWAILYEDEVYPCKLLISWANIYSMEKSLFRMQVISIRTWRKYIYPLKILQLFLFKTLKAK